jgi:DNA repair exonuclease SbcCD ATPase subunit
MRCEGLLEQIALGEQQRRELATAQGQIEELQVQLEASQASQAAAAAARIEAGKLEQELRVREALLAEAQTRQETCRVELATALEQLQDAQAQLALAHERQKELRREVAAAQNTARATDAGGSGGDGAELARMREALDAAHLQNHQLVGQLAETSAAGDTDELKKLRKERDTLKRKLAEVESKEGSRSAADEKNKDDLQRRFEMAVEDVRELKRANADLEAKLKSRGGAVASVAGGGGMDWEAQKQRMLASLEEDDRDDEDAVEERQSIENTIRITDQIVAQKDREIAALKRQLEDLGGNSTAVADLLDHDEIIRQEREKLVEVQTEWREKIGKAEIDISMERARIARERIELEEKLRNYQTERADRPPGETAAADDKPVRGRWLARLGLKDLNDES